MIVCYPRRFATEYLLTTSLVPDLYHGSHGCAKSVRVPHYQIMSQISVLLEYRYGQASVHLKLFDGALANDSDLTREAINMGQGLSVLCLSVAQLHSSASSIQLAARKRYVRPVMQHVRNLRSSQEVEHRAAELDSILRQTIHIVRILQDCPHTQDIRHVQGFIRVSSIEPIGFGTPVDSTIRPSYLHCISCYGLAPDFHQLLIVLAATSAWHAHQHLC